MLTNPTNPGPTQEIEYMGARFKCKKCKTTFNFNDGRQVVSEQIAACEKPQCILRNKNLGFIPLKSVIKENHAVATIRSLPVVSVAVNPVEETVEVYEEQPIGGLISIKEIRKCK